MARRLIDANSLKKEINKYERGLDRRGVLTDDMAAVIANIESIIDEEAPSIEAEPVRHGRLVEWWPGSCALIMTGEEMLWMCSECEAKYSDKENMNYCPNCGARMDAEEDDHG